MTRCLCASDRQHEQNGPQRARAVSRSLWDSWGLVSSYLMSQKPKGPRNWSRNQAAKQHDGGKEARLQRHSPKHPPNPGKDAGTSRSGSSSSKARTSGGPLPRRPNAEAHAPDLRCHGAPITTPISMWSAVTRIFSLLAVALPGSFTVRVWRIWSTWFFGPTTTKRISC